MVQRVHGSKSKMAKNSVRPVGSSFVWPCQPCLASYVREFYQCRAVWRSDYQVSFQGMLLAEHCCTSYQFDLSQKFMSNVAYRLTLCFSAQRLQYIQRLILLPQSSWVACIDGVIHDVRCRGTYCICHITKASSIRAILRAMSQLSKCQPFCCCDQRLMLATLLESSFIGSKELSAAQASSIRAVLTANVTVEHPFCCCNQLLMLVTLLESSFIGSKELSAAKVSSTRAVWNELSTVDREWCTLTTGHMVDVIRDKCVYHDIPVQCKVVVLTAAVHVCLSTNTELQTHMVDAQKSLGQGWAYTIVIAT